MEIKIFSSKKKFVNKSMLESIILVISEKLDPDIATDSLKYKK